MALTLKTQIFQKEGLITYNPWFQELVHLTRRKKNQNDHCCPPQVSMLDHIQEVEHEPTDRSCDAEKT